MQLCQAETVGVHDRHQRRLRHVDPDLDHARGYEHVEPSCTERLHHALLRLGGHPAVHEAEAKGLQRPVGKFLENTGDAGEPPGGFLDRRHDHVATASLAELAAEE